MKRKYDITYNKLKKLYCDRKLSCKQIADIFGCNHMIIWHRLKEYKIKIRSISESISGVNNPNYDKHKLKGKRSGKNNPFYGKKHTLSLKRLISNLTSGKNNAMYGVHRFGKDNPNWKGGMFKARYTSEFNKQLKEEIRNDWGRKCVFPSCGIPEIECNRALDVHHIDYNKKNCSEVNLIPLCRKHNSMVNKNRKHWEEYFTQLQISRIPERLKKEGKR